MICFTYKSIVLRMMHARVKQLLSFTVSNYVMQSHRGQCSLIDQLMLDQLIYQHLVPRTIELLVEQPVVFD